MKRQELKNLLRALKPDGDISDTVDAISRYNKIRHIATFYSILYLTWRCDMWDLHTRILAEAEHIVKTNSTVRAAAVHFGISKSTVHKDVTERLRAIDKKLYEQVRKVLNRNLSERHIRGGIATKNKYLNSRTP